MSPTEIRDYIEQLKAEGRIEPWEKPLIDGRFKLQSASQASKEFQSFLHSVAENCFRLGGLLFCAYPGISKKNLNDTHRWYPDTDYSEYNDIFEFAHSLEHHLSLAIDLSDVGRERFAIYLDTGHGTDDQCWYIADDVSELIGLMSMTEMNTDVPKVVTKA